jgi:hypothetical protein
MHDYAAGVAIFLFGCALPGSLFAWALVTIGAARLRDPKDQPLWYRTYMRVLSSLVRDDPSPTGVALGVLFLVVFNFMPVALLVRNPYGDQALIIDLVYLVVEGAFLVPLVRAMVRSRARARGR